MILFATEYNYTFNSSGAASLSSSHLNQLIKVIDDDGIIILYLGDKVDFWEEQPDFEHSKIEVIYLLTPPLEFRPLKLKEIITLFTSKEIDKIPNLIFEFEDKQSYLKKIGEIISEKSPKYIWCEHFGPLIYVKTALNKIKIKAKIINSHHDFLYKILILRQKSLRTIVRSMFLKRIEIHLIRSSSLFVSGSLFELNEAKKIAPNQPQIFLPCVYSFKTTNERETLGINLYHFGTIKATANKIGLSHFFKNIIPFIIDLPIKIVFVGDVENYIHDKFPSLAKNSKLIFMGFVRNLDEVFIPHSLHVLPYKGKSGTRTRVASLLPHTPCLVGYFNLVDNYPFLKNGINSLLANTDEEFILNIRKAVNDKNLCDDISKRVIEDYIIFQENISMEFKKVFTSLN